MGPRMETCCRRVLLLVTVAAAATAVPSQHKTLSYEEAIALAVDFYNQGSGLDRAFRLLKADPQPEWDVSSKTIQPVKFTVQETVCLVSGKRDISQCEFKEDGVRITCCTETSPSVGSELYGPVVTVMGLPRVQGPGRLPWSVLWMGRLCLDPFWAPPKIIQT
uniref:Uncharacterized protein n=1 Tax=Chrysemys picta bellii TaxID=8478 RepID=A0A8C3HP95_CHRPI